MKFLNISYGKTQRKYHPSCWKVYLSKSKLLKIKEMGKIQYAQAVGNMIYVMTSIRQNIYHAIRLVSQCQANPIKNIGKR